MNQKFFRPTKKQIDFLASLRKQFSKASGKDIRKMSLLEFQLELKYLLIERDRIRMKK